MGCNQSSDVVTLSVAGCDELHASTITLPDPCFLAMPGPTGPQQGLGRMDKRVVATEQKPVTCRAWVLSAIAYASAPTLGQACTDYVVE